MRSIGIASPYDDKKRLVLKSVNYNCWAVYGGRKATDREKRVRALHDLDSQVLRVVLNYATRGIYGILFYTGFSLNIPAAVTEIFSAI